MEVTGSASGRARRAAYDVGIYSVAQVTSAALALVLLGLMGRALGRAGFGEFSFAFVVASLGGLVADFGMGPWITRTAAQHPEHSRNALSGVLSLRARTVVVAWVLTLGASWFYVHDAKRWLEIAILVVYITELGYVAVHESLLMGRRRTGWVALSTAGGKVLELAAAALYLWKVPAPTVTGVALALAIACAIRLVAVAIAARAVLRLDPFREDAAAGATVFAVPIWRQLLPFAAGSLLWTTYFKVDVLLLERFVPRGDLGLYTAAYRVLEALLLIPRSVVGVLFPRLAEAWASGSLGSGMLSRPAKGLVAVAAGAGAGLLVLAPETLRFLFGPDFTKGAPALVVLAGAMIFVFVNQYLGAILVAVHRQGRWLAVTLAALALNVGSNLLLIPRLGFAGAAWATFISEAAMAVALALLVVPRFGKLFAWTWLLRVLLAAGVMAGLVSIVPLAFPWRIALGAVFFAVLVWALRVVDREDRMLLASLARGRA